MVYQRPTPVVNMFSLSSEPYWATCTQSNLLLSGSICAHYPLVALWWTRWAVKLTGTLLSWLLDCKVHTRTRHQLERIGFFFLSLKKPSTGSKALTLMNGSSLVDNNNNRGTFKCLLIVACMQYRWCEVLRLPHLFSACTCELLNVNCDCIDLGSHLRTPTDHSNNRSMHLLSS